jgi:hypothetical protein
MVPADIVGRTGRALTEIGASGQVDVDGQTYDAMTFRPPIAPGDAVEVTGWRLVGGGVHVLSVRRPGDESPPSRTRTEEPVAPARAPEFPPTPSRREVEHEDRIRSLERRLATQQRHQARAPGTIATGAGVGLALGLFFSLVLYRGPGLSINVMAFVLWALGGAVVGIIVHLVRGPDGNRD